jgi:hypothetical protein
MAKNIAVFGIYPGHAELEAAVDSLRRSGFRNTDISLLMAENEGSKDLVHKKTTKVPEGVAAGATSGAVLGGAFGWLVGIGALTVPGLGPLIAAGPVVAALAAAGAAGATGGLLGGLIGMGIPEYEAKRYQGRVRNGGNLLSVHCDDGGWASRARKILHDSGGEDISSVGESAPDFAKSDKPRPRGAAVDEDELAKKRDV